MDRQLSTAARTVRAHLERLTGTDAADIDARLADLIVRGNAGEDVDEDLSTALTSTPALHAWTARLIGDAQLRPAEVQDAMVRSSLPGDPEPVVPPRYRCPDASRDFVWYQLFVGEDIPACPTHNAALILDQDSA